jgi:hypothetical protein
MSCRTTQGGTLMTRLGRIATGLPDKKITSLFHALKREGDLLEEPSKAEVDSWRSETRDTLNELELSAIMMERSERDLFLAKDEDYDGATFHALKTIVSRARQEAVIISVKSAVADLSEPLAEKDSYDLDDKGSPKYVWYASYGSNLNEARFLTYIKGGSPDGTNSSHQGARDKTSPKDSTPIRFNGRMHFAGTSYKWGRGGIAFIDKDTSGHALGRAYLITFEQFEDVVAQENGKATGSVTISGIETLKKGSTEVGAGLYNNLIHIGDYRGYPVFTFTSSFTAKDAVADAQISTSYKKMGSTNKPSDNYLRMIAKGLEESFGMSIEEQSDYLRGTLGAGEMSKETLIQVLSTPAEIIEKEKPFKYGSPSRTQRSVLSESDWREDDWDKWNWEDGSWRPKAREETPWWEEAGEDEDSDEAYLFGGSPNSNKKSSSSYYDSYIDEPNDFDYYNDEDSFSIYDNDMYRSIDEIPMAFRNLDGSIKKDADFENYCGICEKVGHNIDSCSKL